MRKRLLSSRMVFAAIAGVFAASQVLLNAQQSAVAVRVGKDAIGGVVSSTNGPEASFIPSRLRREKRFVVAGPRVGFGFVSVQVFFLCISTELFRVDSASGRKS